MSNCKPQYYIVKVRNVSHGKVIIQNNGGFVYFREYKINLLNVENTIFR